MVVVGQCGDNEHQTWFRANYDKQSGGLALFIKASVIFNTTYASICIIVSH